MEIIYRRTIGQSFMVITEENIRTDYQIEMCRRNRIESFLTFDAVVADGQLEFWYDITGMQSLEEYVKHKKLGMRQLKLLFKSICDGIRQGEEYLLRADSVLLEPEFIFLSHDEVRIRLCCCPGITQIQGNALHVLSEYLLPFTDHGEDEAVRLSYQVYQITLEENYGLDRIYTLLEQKKEKDIAPVQEEQRIVSEECEESRINEKVYKLAEDKMSEIKSRIGEWKERIFRNKKEPFVFEPMEQREESPQQRTVFLGAGKEEKKMKQLIYQGEEPGRNIELKEEIYCIGSQKDADIVIDNQMVSRLHARLNRVEGVYYIEDLNSRNGTWVNGQLLHYMEKLPLTNGDMICFAEENYCYKED